MGSRYRGADRSTGGHQARHVDEDERENERQTVLGAFADAVAGGKSQGQATNGSVGGGTDTGGSQSENWPSTRGTADERAQEREDRPKQRRRGRTRGQVSRTLGTLIPANVESMSEDDHRDTRQLLEQAAERGVSLSESAAKGLDSKVHSWLEFVGENKIFSQKTRRRLNSIADFLL